MTNRSCQSKSFKKLRKMHTNPSQETIPMGLQCITSESHMSGAQITQTTEKVLDNTFECLKPLF